MIKTIEMGDSSNLRHRVIMFTILLQNEPWQNWHFSSIESIDRSCGMQKELIVTHTHIHDLSSQAIYDIIGMHKHIDQSTLSVYIARAANIGIMRCIFSFIAEKKQKHSRYDKQCTTHLQDS